MPLSTLNGTLYKIAAYDPQIMEHSSESFKIVYNWIRREQLGFWQMCTDDSGAGDRSVGADSNTT